MLRPLLFLLFTVLPFLELWLLLQIGGEIGALPTLGLVVLAGLLGAHLVRTQGVAALQRIRAEMAQGRVPAAALLDGVLILAAGLLMITPGVITDVLAVLLMIPPVRGLVGAALTGWARKHVKVVAGPGAFAPGAYEPWPAGGVKHIDAEVRDPTPAAGKVEKAP